MSTGPDATEDAAPAICLSVAIQMDPLWRPGRPGEGYGGDLKQFAEDMTRYLVVNLERFGDQRSADLFVALTAQRGDESAGHEYRSGHYVKDEAEPEAPAAPAGGQITTTPPSG